MAKKDGKLKEFEFVLSENIIVHKDGQIEHTNKIVFKAPSSRQQAGRIKLKGIVTKALNDASERANKGKTEKEKELDHQTAENSDVVPSASDLMMILFSCLDESSLLKLYDEFDLLISSGCGYVLETIKLNDHIIESFNNDDKDKMIGEYLTNFILRSLMKDLNKT